MDQMNRRTAVLSTLGLLCGTGLLRASGPENKSISWQPNMKAAHRISREQNKPMMIVFGAEWCGYCKKLERTTLENPQLSKYINNTFVSVHVDVDEEEKVAKILDVKSLPCTIILSPSADLLGRFEGYMQPTPMYQKLAAANKLHLDTLVTASR